MHFSSSLLPICIPALLLLAVATAGAQQTDSLHVDSPRDSTRLVLSAIELIGTTPIPIQSLNTFLANNNVAPTYLSGRDLTIGAAISTDIGSWLAEVDLLVSHVSAAESSTRVALFHQSLQLNAGYRAVELGRFRLTPFAGLGVRFNSLNVSNAEPGQFTSFIGDSSTTSFDVSNTVLHAELGAGVDYVLPFLENPFAYTDLLFGVRVGYTQGLSDNGWRHEGHELSGGPDMIHSGLSAWLTIGWQLWPRKVDSQTVATYRAEVARQEQQRGPKWRFGIIGGPYWSSFFTNDHSNNDVSIAEGDMRNTATFGAMASYRIHGALSLQANLLYSGRGGEVYDFTRTWGRLMQDDSINPFQFGDSSYDLRTRYTADYLELPLFASIAAEFGDIVALRLTCGAYGALLLNSFVESERSYWPTFDNGQILPEHSTFTQGTPDLPSFDAGALLGIALDINTTGPDFTLEARGTIGFNDVNIAGTAIRYRMAAILLGCWF